MQVYIKPGISIMRDRETELIHFSLSVSSIHKVYRLKPEYLLFFKLVQTYHDVNKLFSKIKEKYPFFNRIEFAGNIDALRKEGILMVKTTLPKDISRENAKRYQRQVQFFSDLNPETINSWKYQSKLNSASVVIIGLGGIGSWIAQSLTMAGVGSLILCDFDTVSLHNLTRQTLYEVDDIGSLKTTAMALHLKQNNPQTKIKKINFKLNSEKDLSMIASYIKSSNLIINCADFPDINTTSTWIANQCMAFNKPHIIGGGYSGHVGLIGPTILPYQSACWNCFKRKYDQNLKNQKFDVLLNTRKSSGAIVFLSNIIANIQAWDGIRVLTGIGDPVMLNRKGFLNLDTLTIDWEFVSKDPHCEMCREKY